MDEERTEAEHARTSSEELRHTVTLIRAHRGGDETALDELFHRYYPVVRRIVGWRMTGLLRRVTDADDLVQDALIRAFKRIDSFKHRSDATFKNWLAKIVQNHINDVLRSAQAQKHDVRRLRPFAQDSDAGLTASRIPDSRTPSQHAVMREALAAEQARNGHRDAAIRELPETYRELISLREECGMTFNEIAVEVGKRPATVRMMYNRVCAKLDAAQPGGSAGRS